MNGIAACVSSPTKVDLFWLDSNFKLVQKSGNGTQWDASWNELGGTFITTPAAVATNSQQLGFPGLIDVFGVGTDFAMYAMSFAQGAWSGDFVDLRGDFISAPGVIGRPNGRLDIFGVGSDYAMYHRFRDGPPGSQRWRPDWEYLGGRFSSGASVVSRDITSIDVFARGADFTLRHRRNVSGVWAEDWQNLGGSLASPPVAVSWKPNRMDVFAVGSDGALWHRWWDGEIWNDWESHGGLLTQTPSVVSWGPGRLDVFALGVDAAIHHFWFDNQAWSGRESFGGQDQFRFTSGPTAVSPAPGSINLVGPGTDKNIYAKFGSGATYTPANFDIVGSGHFALPTRYHFSVDHVRVTTTRALNADTNTAVAAVAAGNWPTQTITQSLGEMGGLGSPDSAQTNRLRFEPVTVELCEASFLQYTVVNAGHADQETVNKALVNAAGSITNDAKSSVSKAIGAGVGAITGIEVLGASIVTPIVGSLISAAIGYLLGKLGEMVFVDCDGPVASETVPFVHGKDLFVKTQGGPITVTTTFPGAESPALCGANSEYEVTYTIRRA